MNHHPARKVNINRNPKVAEGDTLPYPLHKIIGVLPTEQSAWQAIDELTARGFAEGEMELWTGQSGAAAMDETLHHAHLIGRLSRRVAELGMEGPYINEYDEALRAGQFLLVVPAGDEEAKETGREALAAHGARHVTYFGRLTIEILVP